MRLIDIRDAAFGWSRQTTLFRVARLCIRSGDILPESGHFYNAPPAQNTILLIGIGTFPTAPLIADKLAELPLLAAHNPHNLTHILIMAGLLLIIYMSAYHFFLIWDVKETDA